MRFVISRALLFAALLLGVATARPPNVVFILADDLGIMDVGAFATKVGGADAGGLYYETPHMDALAGRGIAFSQAYANQLCSPTRAAILTGRIASTIGVTTATPRTPTYYNQGRPVPEGYSPHDAYQHKDRIKRELAWHNGHSNTAVSPKLPTLPQVLKSHDSAFIGKWHLGGHGAVGQQPRDHGFEEMAYQDAGGSAYFNWRRAWDNRKPPYPTMPQKESAMGHSGESMGEEFLTDELTAQAVRYLGERAKTPDKPFFLYFCQFSVHTPLQAKAETIAHFEKKPQRGANGHNHPTYAAMVKHLDDSVGAVVEALEKTGLADNTLLVFFSDNGGVEYTNPPATDNAPFKGGKACLYEGGVRVPMVVWQKGRFEGGKWCDAVVDCTDMLPTLATLTGNAVPDGVDGMSIVPVLENPAGRSPQRTLIWHYPFNVIVKHPDNGFPLTPHSAIRVGDHKLIWDWHGKLELYDIPRDPFEKNDLSADKPELAQKLFRRLRDWLKENVAPRYLPQQNAEYDASKDERGAARDLWAGE